MLAAGIANQCGVRLNHRLDTARAGGPTAATVPTFTHRRKAIFDHLSLRYGGARYILVGTLILLLATSFPLVAAAGHSSDASFGGDDVYDPASPKFAAAMGEIAGFEEPGLAFGGGYRGDDAYDPAAGGLYEAFGFASASDDCDDPSGLAFVGSFSGDDAYDPAAGGIANSYLMGIACLLPGIAFQ